MIGIIGFRKEIGENQLTLLMINLFNMNKAYAIKEFLMKSLKEYEKVQKS